MSLKVKELAEIKEETFRENPFDISLKTHKLKGGLKGFWSFSINQKFRIIFEFVNDNEVWFHSVGDHAIYNLWD